MGERRRTMLWWDLGVALLVIVAVFVTLRLLRGRGQTSQPVEITDDKGVHMRLVPAGEFIMGSAAGDPDEQPVRTVYLDAFYMDTYEVTNARYKECVTAGVCRPPKSDQTYRYTPYYSDPQYAEYRCGGLVHGREVLSVARGAAPH